MPLPISLPSDAREERGSLEDLSEPRQPAEPVSRQEPPKKSSILQRTIAGDPTMPKEVKRWTDVLSEDEEDDPQIPTEASGDFWQRFSDKHRTEDRDVPQWGEDPSGEYDDYDRRDSLDDGPPMDRQRERGSSQDARGQDARFSGPPMAGRWAGRPRFDDDRRQRRPSRDSRDSDFDDRRRPYPPQRDYPPRRVRIPRKRGPFDASCLQFDNSRGPPPDRFQNRRPMPPPGGYIPPDRPSHPKQLWEPRKDGPPSPLRRPSSDMSERSRHSGENPEPESARKPSKILRRGDRRSAERERESETSRILAEVRKRHHVPQERVREREAYKERRGPRTFGDLYAHNEKDNEVYCASMRRDDFKLQLKLEAEARRPGKKKTPPRPRHDSVGSSSSAKKNSSSEQTGNLRLGTQDSPVDSREFAERIGSALREAPTVAEGRGPIMFPFPGVSGPIPTSEPPVGDVYGAASPPQVRRAPQSDPQAYQLWGGAYGGTPSSFPLGTGLPQTGSGGADFAPPYGMPVTHVPFPGAPQPQQKTPEFDASRSSVVAIGMFTGQSHPASSWPVAAPPYSAPPSEVTTIPFPPSTEETAPVVESSESAFGNRTHRVSRPPYRGGAKVVQKRMLTPSGRNAGFAPRKGPRSSERVRQPRFEAPPTATPTGNFVITSEHPGPGDRPQVPPATSRPRDSYRGGRGRGKRSPPPSGGRRKWRTKE